MLCQSKYKFDVLFSGDDWKGTERYNKTEQQFAKIGVSIEYLPYTQGIYTTQINDFAVAKDCRFSASKTYHFGGKIYEIQ